ncbi:MAG: helix-turn-helix transcriptional regulator, partial [Ignavibacteriaceae bacterium]
MRKIIRVPINPEILKWALEDLNLSVEDFAHKVGVKAEKVNDWLSGASSPTYNQLESISYKILKLPMAAFFLSEPPKNLSIKKKFRTLPEYLLELTSFKTRLAVKKADFYKTALFELFKFNPSVSPLFKKIKLTVNDDITKDANVLRRELGINIELQRKFSSGYQAFNHYREMLENKGVFLFQLQLSGDRGFCLIDEE